MIRNLARRAASGARRAALGPLLADQHRLLLAVGRMESRNVRACPRPRPLAEVEFRIFSQFGEDGIIQYLTGLVPIASRTFVEFGVESYRESNTRFLLENDSWQGLILDGGTDHLDFIERTGLRWRHLLEARSTFLTRDNIDAAIAGGGMGGDIGLLSVDVDGNDYWLLDALTVVSPRILCVEYNSLFGPQAAVTVPYDPGFRREAADHSGLYYGASLAALHALAVSRNYALVGCGSAGVNAFFVRNDVRGDIPALSPEAAFVPRTHREARDRAGRLTYTTAVADQLALIEDLPLLDVGTGRTGRVRDLVPLGGLA